MNERDIDLAGLSRSELISLRRRHRGTLEQREIRPAGTACAAVKTATMPAADAAPQKEGPRHRDDAAGATDTTASRTRLATLHHGPRRVP